MTKRKMETAKSVKVKITRSSGRVIKAKNIEMPPEAPSTKKKEVKLNRTPLVLRQRKITAQDPTSATPFLEKCTSTPMITEIKSKEHHVAERMSLRRILKPNRKYKDFTSAFSPILGDIGNRARGRGEKDKSKDSIQGAELNQNMAKPSPIKSDSEQQKKKSLILAAPSGGRSLIPSPTGPIRATKRKSVGIRRVVVSPDDESLDKVVLRHRKASQMVSEPLDHTLVKRLRADWSSTTIEGTPTQIDSIVLKSPQRQPLRVVKRRLTPLLEITVDESAISTAKLPQVTSAVTKPTEDVYSSSEEFESEDGKENSRSKRAPTWKDLSTKMAAPTLQTTPKVRVRRSRIHSKIPTPSPREKDNCIPGLTPKVRVRRSRIHSKIPILSPRDPKEADVCFPRSTPKVRVRRSRVLAEISTSNPNESDNCILEATKTPNNLPVPLNINDSSQAGSISVLRTIEAAVEGENRKEATNSLEDLSAENAISPSRSQNLLNKSDLIEQILSSTDVDEENNPPDHLIQSNNANTTKKFFHSRIDTTIAVPTTIKPVNARKSSGRKKKQDKIYEFLSQSSSDAADPVADVIQKMIKTGKVTVAKHKKGAGKPVIKPVKRKPRKKMAIVEDVFVKPPSRPKRKVLQEKVVNTVHFDEDTHFDDGGAEFFEEAPNRDQRGFSDLARSAMIKQATGKSENTPPQRKMITDRKKLLEVAQKFVGGQSPSARLPLASPSTVAQLSPIPGSTSPWRVDDDRFPNLFYFSRNSDNLPSFSSDYIPSTPSKNKSKSKSSFSSNDSNMENIAPPSAKATTNENSNQNTRRALSYRSPLKPINIIEVINLPPLAMNKTNKETNKETTRNEKSVTSNTSKTNLFGFEDLIDDNDGDFTGITLNQSAISNTQHLKTKMQRLRRLRPEKPVVTTSKNTRIKPVFDERPKQKTLQQMLCSTMIERERQSETANDDVQHNSYFNEGCDVDLSNLFKDPEPETTFDESVSRRTYSRPFRKKRKLRNTFVLFMDSDASEDEEEDKCNEKKSKKRQRKDPKEKAELNKFVDEFNEMCKEVSEYELIVE